MCFSATASLVAGGTLSAVGVVTIAQTKSRKNLAIATLPLLFGAQQLIDGAVWLTSSTIATYAYAILAFVFWPIFVPFAVAGAETNRVRREIVEALMLVGIGVGMFFLYFIITNGVTVGILNHCVAYDTPHPYRYAALAFYLLATCGLFLLSSRPILRFFGLALSVSFGVAGWFYVENLTSVWCFFSALLSIIVYWYIRKDK